MVVTLTLNPAIDVTARVEKLSPGALNRLSESVVNAGGKGINTARMVRQLGGEALATGFAGGASGSILLQMLANEGLAHDFIPVPGETRINMKILDTYGGMTELNGAGCPAGSAEYQTIESLLMQYCTPETVFVLSGSLPPGANPDFYAYCIRKLRDGGARTVLDASGEALRLGALAQPDIIKANATEINDFDRESYRGFLVWSLGAEGARFYKDDRELFIPALPVEVVSPAGAGDCMTGALAYSLDKSLPFEEAALLSAAAATAAVRTPGTGCPPLSLIKECRMALVCHWQTRAGMIK